MQMDANGTNLHINWMCVFVHCPFGRFLVRVCFRAFFRYQETVELNLFVQEDAKAKDVEVTKGLVRNWGWKTS